MPQCRFCFEKAKSNDALITPCKCTGTLKYIHQSCINKWVTEKYAGDSSNNAICEICKDKLLVRKIHHYKIIKKKCILTSLMLIVTGVCIGVLIFEVLFYIETNFSEMTFKPKSLRTALFSILTIMMVAMYILIMFFLIKSMRYRCYKKEPDTFTVIGKETEEESNRQDSDATNKKSLKKVLVNNYLISTHGVEANTVLSFRRTMNLP